MSEHSVSHAWTEEARLAALKKYAILDTSPEQAFDDIVRLAGQLLDAPMAAVSLIDAHRQWFKAEIGLGLREMPLANSICTFALLEAERMVVPDTRDDPRFDGNPLVIGAPGVRFYAGEVLRTADGLPLGTLCILDTRPRPQGLTALQAFALQTLARQVWTQLELRKIVHDQEALLAAQRRMQAELTLAHDRFENIVSQAATGVIQTDAEGRFTVVNRAFCDMLGYDKSELLGREAGTLVAPAAAVAAHPARQPPPADAPPRLAAAVPQEGRFLAVDYQQPQRGARRARRVPGNRRHCRRHHPKPAGRTKPAPAGRRLGAGGSAQVGVPGHAGA